MKKVKRRLRFKDAHILMDQPPFSIKFVTKDGRVDVAENCIKTVSYNRLTGMRRIVLSNGEFRNVYDILILQINETKILVG